MQNTIIHSGSEEMKEFFRSLSLTYLARSRQIISLPSRYHYLNSSYYKRNREEFEGITSRYGESIVSSVLARVSVRHLGETLGYGLFAEDDLPRGSFIGEYAGIIRLASRCRPVKDARGGYATDYAWTYPEKRGFRSIEVNGRDWGNEMRFINHSFDPNCRMEHTIVDGFWVLFFIAQRDIRKDEQLTADYGEEYWTGGFRELMII